MGILTASEDWLRYDPLQENDDKQYDPLGKTASRRIKIYDKNWGFAQHPEEKEASLGYKKQIDERVAQQRAALNEYRNKYSSIMADAGEQAAGILGQYRSVPGQQKVAVSVTHKGQVEGTYYINKEFADTELPGSGLSVQKTDNGYSVDVKVDGRTRGQEIHDMLRDAQDQTGYIDKDISVANQAVSTAKQGTREEIESQRGIAEATYNQNVSQSEQEIARTEALWTTYLSDQQAAFKEGVQANTSGIKNLLDSGALVLKGTIA